MSLMCPVCSRRNNQPDEPYCSLCTRTVNHIKQAEKRKAREYARLMLRPQRTVARWSRANSTKVTLPSPATSEYVPPGFGSLYDHTPLLSVKDITEYWVVKKKGAREVLLARGFKKCCPDLEACMRESCAKCWAFQQPTLDGWRYVIREAIIADRQPHVVDPHGVDPHGKRGRGVALDDATRAKFKLTSSQSHYKAGAAEWSPPKKP